MVFTFDVLICSNLGCSAGFEAVVLAPDEELARRFILDCYHDSGLWVRSLRLLSAQKKGGGG